MNDSDVKRCDLLTFGDLLKLEPVPSRMAVLPFINYILFGNPRFIGLAMRDLYAANMSAKDMRDHYIAGTWPNERVHGELLQEQVEHSNLAARAIKKSVLLTLGAATIGLRSACAPSFRAKS